MVKKNNWQTFKKTNQPPQNTLIQFIVKNSNKYGEYWGEYDGAVFKGYVSSEMAFPKDFQDICLWKKTTLSTKKGKPNANLNHLLKKINMKKS